MNEHNNNFNYIGGTLYPDDTYNRYDSIYTERKCNNYDSTRYRNIIYAAQTKHNSVPLMFFNSLFIW